MKYAERLDAQKDIHWFMVGRLIAEKRAQGVKVISLASGDPDLPTPQPIVDAISEAVQNPLYHRYPFSFQTTYRDAIATWYRQRFDVELDPASEVHPLAGSQERTQH